ncbi:MAG: efflux RND transporter periplasmic adaptor subunit [Gammaproteobacteria bacterium]|nr:efflux RND transporter periplasmic adaptor subunit [Gammaproteobacteria bacterium]NNL46688.1 efflux RND transporter periplasmic adaptor subunit [Woeseiaceae bacterium]
MRYHRAVNPPKCAVFAVLSGLLALTGCNRQPPVPPAPPEIQVSTVTVQPETVTLSSELPGRTSAFRVAEIRPQINGLIVKRLFIEGEEIIAGQVLYQIDSAPFQATLNRARAALSRAEANQPSIQAREERFRELLVDKAVSQQDYDDAFGALKQVEADIASWQAQVEIARINLGYTRVTAPIYGRIGKSSVTDGAIVTAYQPVPLATIQQLDPIYVDVPQSTSDLLRLERRMEGGRRQSDGSDQSAVGLVLEDGTQYAHEGTLQFRDVSVDPSTGSVILRMVFPNPQGVLLPGMFVRAVVTEYANEQAIVVPQQGVMRNPKGEPYALLVDEAGKVEMRMLTLKQETSDQWLVTAGLEFGDRVIVEGQQALLMLPPGTPVTVVATPFEEAITARRPVADTPEPIASVN